MIHLVFAAALLSMASTHPITYHPVSFLPNEHTATPTFFKGTKIPISKPKLDHSFGIPLATFESYEPLWPDIILNNFPLIYLGFDERGQVTPDYSNGLDYPDPLLLRGKNALKAVKCIYGRGELFYHNIPHARALIRNQEERRKNGLEGNNLFSRRPTSPFYRE